MDIVENVGDEDVTTVITGSESGLWYNKVHPLVTVGNLMSVSEEYDEIYKNVVDEEEKKRANVE